MVLSMLDLMLCNCSIASLVLGEDLNKGMNLSSSILYKGMPINEHTIRIRVTYKRNLYDIIVIIPRTP